MAFLLNKKEPIWINIDKPTKKFTVHHKCAYTEKMKETTLKGVGILKRDGGWLKVDTIKEAERLFKEKYSRFEFALHC